jgi:hypothetical protein
MKPDGLVEAHQAEGLSQMNYPAACCGVVHHPVPIPDHTYHHVDTCENSNIPNSLAFSPIRVLLDCNECILLTLGFVSQP